MQLYFPNFQPVKLQENAEKDAHDFIIKMRVEYLTALASFYNVSTDYILGLTDIRSPSIDTQAIIAQTGLTEENVKTLEAFQSIPATANLAFINEFLPVILEGEAMIHYLLLKQTLKMPKQGKGSGMYCRCADP